MRVLTLIPANTSITTSGNTSTFFIPESYDQITVYFEITAVSGTSPTITVYLDGSWDTTSPNFVSIATVASGVSTVGVYSVSTTTRATAIRLRYTVSGTSPNFTVRAGAVAR